MENTRYRMRLGYTAVRRDRGLLQVGLDKPHRAVLTDAPDVRRLLTDLAAGQAVMPDTLPARRAMLALLDADLVRPTDQPRTLPRVGIDAPPTLAAVAASMLGPTSPDPADVVLVLSEGPLARERVDPLIRRGTPYLAVESAPDAWTVGPLVVPGVTACLRCVDAVLAESDPRRALVLGQLAGAHVPHDGLLESLAIAWAVRDALAHLAGDRPATWSASLTLTRDAEPVRRQWLRHPECGCAWDLLFAQEDA